MHESLIRLKFPLMTNEFALVLVQCARAEHFLNRPTCRFQEQEIKQPLGLFVICLRCLEYVSFVVLPPPRSLLPVLPDLFLLLPSLRSVCSSPLVDNHLNSSHPSVQCPTFVFPFVRHLCSLAQLLSSTWLITCTAPVTLRPVT